MTSSNNKSTNFNREVISQARLLDEWTANEEKDGRSPAENMEDVAVSIGVLVAGPYGKSDTIQRFGLAHFRNGTQPEFAKGIPYYVDMVLDELKQQLINSIQTQLSEDPWSSAPAHANATKAGSAEAVGTQAVGVGSGSGSPAGSNG